MFTILSIFMPENYFKYCYKTKQQQQTLMTFCAGNLLTASHCVSQAVHKPFSSQHLPLDLSDRLSHDLWLARVVMVLVVREEKDEESLFSAPQT